MRSGALLQFPLGMGLAQDANPKAKPGSSLKRGVNVRWPKDGTIGKRFGARLLAANQARPEVLRLIQRGSELNAIGDGTNLHTYDAAGDTFRDQGEISEMQLDWSTLHDDARGVQSSDIAVHGDFLVHAWITGDPTRWPEWSSPNYTGTDFRGWVRVVNWRTGQTQLAPTELEFVLGGRPMFLRVLVASNYAFILYVIHGDQTLNYTSINLATMAVDEFFGEIVDDVRADASLFGRFDACVLSSGHFCIVYEADGGGEGGSGLLTALRVTRSNGTLTVNTTETLEHENIRSIAIAESVALGQVFVIYSFAYITLSDPDHRVNVLSVDSTTMLLEEGPSTIEFNFFASQVSLFVPEGEEYPVFAFAGFDQGDDATEISDGEGDFPALITGVLFDDEGDLDENEDQRRRSTAMTMLSRIFSSGGRFYIMAADARYGERDYADGGELAFTPATSSYQLEIQTYAYEHDLASSPPPHRMVGKIDHDIAGMFHMSSMPAVVNIDDDDDDDRTHLAILPFLADAAPHSFNWRTGLRLVRMTRDPSLMADPWRHVVSGQETYFGGGHLGAWDGRIPFDYGMRIPFIVQYTAGSANTGRMAASNGTAANGYIYQFEPAYRSTAGVLHRGPLSVQTDPLIANANGSIGFRLAPATIDCKQRRPANGFQEEGLASCIFIYRTERTGSVLYRLTYEPAYNIIDNQFTLNTISYTDTRRDEDITAEFGGQDDPPVPAVFLSERPQAYTATGELEDCQPPAPYTLFRHNNRDFIIAGDRRTVWFSKDWRENGPGVAAGYNPAQVETYDQDLTGGGGLDDKRIMFWERGLWFVSGDGPTVAGTENRFSPPIPIQSDVGCTNPRSIVAWPGGLMFQSETDIYSVSRGLEIGWVGKDARDTLADYPVITSAVLVASENEVRFTCNNEDGDEGIVLVFDYQRKTWTTRTYEDGAPIADALFMNDEYFFAIGDRVYVEDTTTHLDEVEGVSDVSTEFVPSTIELESIQPSGMIGWQRVRIAKMLGTALSNHALTVSIARDFSDTYEQTESFAAGSVQTTPASHQRAEVALTVQRRQAVQLKFEDAAPANTTTHPLGNGAGFRLEGIALLVQSKPGLPRDTPSRRGG